MHKTNLNFIQRTQAPRLLQTGVVIALLGCGALGSALITSRGQTTATIADTLASASFSVVPAPGIPVQPKAISEQGATSVARGILPDTIRYYEQGSGRAFSMVLASRRTEVISEKRLVGFQTSYWVPGSQKVISAFTRPTGTSYRLYDYATQTTVDVGENLKSLTIAPDGTTVAWLKRNSDDSYSIITSSLDSADHQERLVTRTEDSSLVWRTNEELALTSRRSDRAGYDLSLLPANGVITVLLSNKENLETLWSPDGQYLLYSYFAPDSGVTLWLRSLQSGAEVALGIATSATKCAWHNNTLAVTCGVPMRKSLTRDVTADRTATIDDIYVYDFSKTTLRLVYGGESSLLMGVTDPLLSSTDNYFVFTNMFDSRLYELPLN